ncbi:MAG TPA: hypothetical protein PKM78_07680 [Anaerolineae bacterium]|nr:hypothetical protein [Anaerolineae bacterium]
MAGVDAVTIGRARVAGWPGHADALAARLAIAQTLASADLRPPGLAPAAVLIVRHLPWRGEPRLPLGRGRPVDPAWERAGRAALADLARRAVRPWDGPAPPDCPAVLFSDEAEMLACLALDVSRGRAAERWWWQMIPGRHGWGSLAPGALAAVLLDRPALLPAVLRLLHGRDQAAALVRRLTPTEADAALRACCAAHDLATPVAAPAPPSAAPLTSSPAAPWRPWLSAAAVAHAGLAAGGELLLGVALTLAHAPSLARSPDFGRQVQRWQQGAVSAAVNDGQPVTPAQGADLPAEAAGRATSAPPQSGQRAVNRWTEAPETVTPASRDAPQEVRDPGDAQDQAPAAPDGPAGQRAVPPDRPLPSTAAGSNRASRSLAPVAAQGLSADAAQAAAALTEGVATQLGGVLFLLNVMQQLDLPDCFEAEWRLASAVGPWGVLELLGRALLLDAARLPTFPKVGNLDDLAADPLWAALAAIDGREPGQPPGARFAAFRDSLHIPAAWLAWLDDADVDQTIDLAPIAPLDGSLLAGVSRDMRRWLAAVTPLLRQMLVGALGDAEDVAAELLLRRGQLYVTSSHVDLMLPLAAVSLPVRIAGLDFDPGWLPRFGRVVRFHYDLV